MQKPEVSLVIGLLFFICSCSGPSTTALFKYFFDNWLIPKIDRMNNIVILTDDPDNPLKVLCILESTSAIVEQSIRQPDAINTSTLGYSAWDYCYIEGYRISLTQQKITGQCRALRLWFNQNRILYDYSEEVVAKLR